MLRQSFTVLIVLACTSASRADGAKLRYKWTKGHVLTYQVEHLTKVADGVGEATVQTSNRVSLTKQWAVRDVDGDGSATLELSLAKMRIETTTPNGETMVFDSEEPAKSNPQLAKFVGKPVAVLRVDPRGRVVEVKTSTFGPMSRYERQLPFICELPAEAVSTGSKWSREYQITLEPPQGTGEKYPSLQHFECKSVTAKAARIELRTELKKLPEAFMDRIPLIQATPRGAVQLDVENGRYLGADLVVKEELKNGAQADGQQYRFESTYRERLVSHR